MQHGQLGLQFVEVGGHHLSVLHELPADWAIVGPGGEPFGYSDPIGKIYSFNKLEMNEVLPATQRVI